MISNRLPKDLNDLPETEDIQSFMDDLDRPGAQHNSTSTSGSFKTMVGQTMTQFFSAVNWTNKKAEHPVGSNEPVQPNALFQSGSPTGMKLSVFFAQVNWANKPSFQPVVDSDTSPVVDNGFSVETFMNEIAWD